MKRQIDSALFERLALSKDKKGVLQLAEKGQIIGTSSIIKDPYVFEFLNLSKDAIIKERGLEKKLIDNLKKFLLEQGLPIFSAADNLILGKPHASSSLLIYICSCRNESAFNPALL